MARYGRARVSGRVVASVSAVLLLAACGPGPASGGSSSGGRRPTSRKPVTHRTTTATRTTGTTTSTTTTTGSGGTFDGQVVGAFLDSEWVPCDAIDAGLRLTAQGGAARWTAVAKRAPDFADPRLAQGVTVSPESGELAEGASTTVRVRGAYDGGDPYFYVVVVYRDGSGSTGLEFRCR